MPILAGSDELVCRLIVALGLRPDRTRGFTLTCAIDDVVRLTVDQYGDTGQIEQVAMVFEKSGLSLVPVGERPAEEELPMADAAVEG